MTCIYCRGILKSPLLPCLPVAVASPYEVVPSAAPGMDAWYSCGAAPPKAEQRRRCIRRRGWPAFPLDSLQRPDLRKDVAGLGFAACVDDGPQ